MAAKPSEHFAWAWEGEGVPWCLAVTVPLGTALSLVWTGLSRYVSHRPRLQTRRCQGGPPALTVPAARCPGPSVCLAVPRVRRVTSQPCLHILPTPSTPHPPPHPCSGTVCLSLDPRGLKPAQNTVLPKASRGCSAGKSPPPRGGRTPPVPWSRTHMGRAPLHRAPPGLGAWRLEASGLRASSQRLFLIRLPLCPSVRADPVAGLWTQTQGSGNPLPS